MKRVHKKASIGVFDSGFGGLTTLKAISKRLPHYNYVYLGDTARVPYGSRSSETIYAYTKQAVDFLFAEGCELIIVACNTASAEALRRIQREHLPHYGTQKRVLGVIVPAAEEAAMKTNNGRIGLIATESTVASGTFARELSNINPRIHLFAKACPLLVPLIEADEYRSDAARLILKAYLKPLLAKKIDTLILGCTHYEIMKSMIKKIVGSKVAVLSEGEVVARKLEEYLFRHPELASVLTKKSKTIVYSTDLSLRFEKLGTRFLGRAIAPIRIALD